jgi:hypothetical protein
MQFDLGARNWPDAREQGLEGWGAPFDIGFLFLK